MRVTRKGGTWRASSTRTATAGTFRATLLRNAAGAVAGWHLYYANPGGVNEVLQHVALPRHAAAVHDHLLWRSQEDGAIAVRGQLHPELLEPLLRGRALWSLADGSLSFVHGRDPELASALQRGDAWLTALEGEAWLRSPLDEL